MALMANQKYSNKKLRYGLWKKIDQKISKNILLHNA